MWARGVSFVLRVIGRGTWNPFLRVLANQGRPSPVFFPPELIDQGLGLALTGLTNSFAFQGHAAWALPWWAEQQVRPDSDSFIPSGVNVLTVNLTHRNWTTVGSAGAPWKAMVDPCGMLTPRAFGPSWMASVGLDGATWIPSRLQAGQIEQSLGGGWEHRVATRFLVHDDLVWVSEALPVRHDHRDWVKWTHTLKWTGATPADLTFTIGLRPYNALTLGPIFRSRQKGRTWSLNHQAGLILSLQPDTVWFGKDREDPLLTEPPADPSPRGRSRNGWLAGCARWQLHLEPGQEWRLEGYALIPLDDRRLRWRSLDTSGLPAAAALAENGLVQRPDPLGFRCADPGVQTMVKALVNHLPVFDNGTHFAPGTFFYNHHWLRDSTFLALAHDLWGLHDQVASKESHWMRTQKRSGHYTSHSGEWDGTGQTLFTWMTHALLTGSDEVLFRHWRRLARGARWVARARRREGNSASPRAGLLPAGLSAEHFGPNDHYFWDNFWSLAGMDRLRLALRQWHQAPPAAQRFTRWLEQETTAYRSDLENHISRLVQLHGGILPSSPYRHSDAACIGTLVALGPLDLDLGSDLSIWARANAEFLLEHWVRDGLFYQPIIHTGGNAYLTAQLASAFQCLGDPRWLGLLQGIQAHASPTWTWPEAIHPRTGGGCMGDGDHGWACAEVLSLVRNALVREQGGHILVLPNAPEAWWRTGTLALTGCPTLAGRLTFALSPESDGTHTLTWEFQRSSLRAPWPLQLALPEGWEADVGGLGPAETPWGGRGITLQDAGRLSLQRK